MISHLLVPLDGSHLAESVIPYAAYLSDALGAHVTLVHVIERNVSPEIHGDHHLTNEDEACAYLGTLAERQFFPTVDVVSHVHSEMVSDVALSIVQHTSEFGSDLIIMCTHGNSGFMDRMVGSIAQQIIGLGTTPVLLIPPSDIKQPHEISFKRFIVGLDADPEHETALPIASALAKKTSASLHLVHVVHTMSTLKMQNAATSRLLPSTTAVMLDMMQDYAFKYLEECAAPYRAEGLQVTTQVCRGDPPQQLVQSAAETQADLIALGTHGKAGMSAFWSGSVAPQITTLTSIPLLLVPVKKR